MISNYKYKPLKYFAIAFTATYTLWLTAAYLSFQSDKTSLYMIFTLLGLMAPFITSTFMIFTSKNSDLKKDFINRLINPKLIQPKIIPVFLFIMPVSVLISIVISLLFGQSTCQFQLAKNFSFSSGFVPVLLLLGLAATFEELGWRGYAFDSLQSRYTFFKASIIFGMLWSLWHFPLIFIKNSYQYEIFNQSTWFALNFFISIIPIGIIISWICIKNNKSILAAILFHFIINLSQEALQITQFTKCIETLVLIVIATIIVITNMKMFFDKPLRAQKETL